MTLCSYLVEWRDRDLISATVVIKKTQCFPVALSSLAKPAERFKYSRVAHFEAGRKLVEENSEVLRNLIFRNVHVVPGKDLSYTHTRRVRKPHGGTCLGHAVQGP